jgi:site-specific DNA recombinase
MSATAAIYTRISDDREGLEAGVGRQEADCRALAEKEGLEVIEVFTDNDRGASTRSRKPRPQYREMMRRAELGEFDFILAYSNSRLTRRPSELEQFIQLYERRLSDSKASKGRPVEFRTVVSGWDDLSKADGRMVARIKASVDAAEAERTGERVQRAHEENARQGKPVGGYRPFGWKADRATLDPLESEIVRSIVSNLVAGASLRSAVQGLNEAGVTTTAGNPWTSQTLRQYLKSPRIYGVRTYRREVMRHEGKVVAGQWEPIISEDDFDRLQKIFDKPDNRSRQPRRDARHYLLTGTVRCGTCNDLMYGNRYGSHQGSERYYYVCNRQGGKKHTVGVSGHGTDALVGTLILNKMAEEGPTPNLDRRFTGEARIDELEELIEGTLDQLGKVKVSPERIFGQVEKFEVELRELKRERDEWLASTIGPAKTQLTPAEWLALDTDHRRGFVEKYLSAVYIKPAVKRQNRLDPERIVPVWREV